MAIRVTKKSKNIWDRLAEVGGDVTKLSNEEAKELAARSTNEKKYRENLHPNTESSGSNADKSKTSEQVTSSTPVSSVKSNTDAGDFIDGLGGIKVPALVDLPLSGPSKYDPLTAELWLREHGYK